MDFPIHKLDAAIASGLNFFCFRKRGEDIVFGASNVLNKGITTPGFVISSFKGEMYTIPKDITIEEIESLETSGVTPIVRHLPATTSQSDYMSGAETIISNLRKRGHGKVVYSRVEQLELSKPVSDVFGRLCSLYSSACVFMFYSSESGLWIGASPEMLLAREGDKLQTMALAGTRPAGTHDDWDIKNIEEHELVVAYISDWMKNNGMTSSKMPRFTLAAGPVEHLCTKIQGKCSAATFTSVKAFEKGLDDFSPTPALGGYPKDIALKEIESVEKHSRGFYGGFFGWIENLENFDIRVNLRSMQVCGNRAALYAGGGLTRFSSPENEWEETCRKTATMLQALGACFSDHPIPN